MDDGKPLQSAAHPYAEARIAAVALTIQVAAAKLALGLSTETSRALAQAALDANVAYDMMYPPDLSESALVDTTIEIKQPPTPDPVVMRDYILKLTSYWMENPGWTEIANEARLYVAGGKRGFASSEKVT